MEATSLYKILDGLYLGAFHQAKEAAQPLIPDTVFINCTKDLPMLGAGVRVFVDDQGRDVDMKDMAEQLPPVVGLIHEQRNAGKNVVVHCLAGQQRSPTVVCAYLMRHCGFSLDGAYRYVLSVKPDVMGGGHVPLERGANFYTVLQKW
jgi:hypothetical protein